MDNYSPQYLYGDLLSSSQFENLKIHTEENLSMENNFVTEEGIYTGSMGVSPMLNCDSVPSDQSFSTENPTTQLPRELAEMVTSLLLDASDDFPLSEEAHPHFDIDVVAAAGDFVDKEDPFNEDIFGDNATSLLHTPGYEVQTIPSVGTAAALGATTTVSGRPRRKSERKAKTKATDALVCSGHSLGYDPQYPDLSELGVPSPASSSSGYSDSCGEDTQQKKGRQRRPRISYNTLTEEEKYKRIRDLNNEASRHYRERQRSLLTNLDKQLPGLIEKNQKLKEKAVALEALRDQLKHFSHQFLREHMHNNVSHDFQM
ncbi:uncharacterized protein LOC135200232 [Macrobrachium nipponense]|uniref:uncharacterized protein LOC135200232 n=1 Tax=Macrobrachium nipponense TaxID=159736 RepID=UPI0030C8829B